MIYIVDHTSAGDAYITRHPYDKSDFKRGTFRDSDLAYHEAYNALGQAANKYGMSKQWPPGG